MKKVYAKNVVWLILERLSAVISGFFVSIEIAKGLGPNDYGILVQCLALVALSSNITRLGIDSYLVKETSNLNSSNSLPIGQLYTASCLLSLVPAIVIVFVFYYFSEANLILSLTAIASVSLIFQSFNSYESILQGTLEAGTIVKVRTIALLGSAIVKLLLVHFDSPIHWIAASYILDQAILCFLYFGFFGARRLFSLVDVMKFPTSLYLAILRSALPLAIATMLATLLIRMDQLMLGWFTNSTEVAIYASAAKLTEAKLMIFGGASIVAIPFLGEKGAVSSTERQNTLLIVAFIVAVLVVMVLLPNANNVIRYSFGAAYEEATYAYTILLVGLPIIFVNNMIGRILLSDGKTKDIVFRNLMAVIINFFTNLILIPTHGSLGAASSTIIALTLTTIPLLAKRTWRA